MKFAEFKEMCLQHKKIQKEQGCKEGRNFLKSFGRDFQMVSAKFLIPYYLLEETLINFFKKENLQCELEKFEMWDGTENVIVKVDGIETYQMKLYAYSMDPAFLLEELFCYDDGTMKNMSYKSGINNILSDFCNLEDDLWECVREKNNSKRNTAIKEEESKIEKYNRELTMLTVPAEREERISLLLATIERIQKNISEIKNTLDEI